VIRQSTRPFSIHDFEDDGRRSGGRAVASRKGTESRPNGKLKEDRHHRETLPCKHPFPPAPLMSPHVRKLAQSFAPCQYRTVNRSIAGRRHLQIQAAPSSTNPSKDAVPISASPISSASSLTTVTPSSSSPDAHFEVLGSTSSLLSVSLSASQPLYTRRGTLVSVSGNPENAISTLSPLSPLRRVPLGVPFLYQKVTSTTPIELLIGTKSPHTSIAVVHLDGRVDWQIAQRNGLVAWTGHRLAVKASVNAQMVGLSPRRCGA